MKKITTGEDVQQIMRAVAFSIDHYGVEEELTNLGYDVRVDTTDGNSDDFTFTVEGGENETGFIAKFALVSIEMGFDTISTPWEKQGADHDA